MSRLRHPITALAAWAVFAVFPYNAVAAPAAKSHAPKPATPIKTPAPVVAPVAPILVAQAIPAAAPPAAIPSSDDYTGLIIDARHLPDILRSPAPALYGPAPDSDLLYPDRSHVPTADEVQDESIVRYYHTEDEARAGVGGSHPFIVRAEVVLGYAHDALELSAADAARLQDLEKSIHFTRTWRVGFLIPATQ